MVMEGVSIGGDEHIIQYIDDLLCNHVPETYMISLSLCHPIYSIKRGKIVHTP